MYFFDYFPSFTIILTYLILNLVTNSVHTAGRNPFPNILKKWFYYYLTKPATIALHVAYLLGVWRGNGFDSQAKLRNSLRCTYCWYLRCPTLIVWVEKWLGSKHAQLGLPDKSRAIKGLSSATIGMFRLIKQSGHTLMLSTVHCGIMHIV